MVTRILSAVVGIIIGIAVLFLAHTLVLNLVIAAISVAGVFEIFKAAKLTEFRPSFITCIVFVGVSPFLMIEGPSAYRYIFTVVAIVVLFATFLAQHNTLGFDKLALMITTATLISLSLCCVITIYQIGGIHGVFYILLTLMGAWIADSGAYFVGTFFGKHKLCPGISPKKTVEGAVGGVVVSALVMMITCYIYTLIMASNGTVITPNYILIAVMGVVCAVMAMLGDLTASLIKRQCGIKDFGSIMPGHGGVMDRFDSVLFVAPFVTLMISYFPLFS